MKFQTTDRELVCLLVALNNSKPEPSHNRRKCKSRAYEQLQLERVEALITQPGRFVNAPLNQLPTDTVEVDLESGTRDYLIDTFGADGAIGGGAFVEITVCKFTDRLRAVENSK
jgi:hypothetical protein